MNTAAISYFVIGIAVAFFVDYAHFQQKGAKLYGLTWILILLLWPVWLANAVPRIIIHWNDDHRTRLNDGSPDIPSDQADD